MARLRNVARGIFCLPCICKLEGIIIYIIWPQFTLFSNYICTGIRTRHVVNFCFVYGLYCVLCMHGRKHYQPLCACMYACFYIGDLYSRTVKLSTQEQCMWAMCMDISVHVQTFWCKMARLSSYHEIRSLKIVEK